MSRNVYETLFILDSNRYARDPGGISGSIPKTLEELGGEVLANRLWVEQKLAYPIQGHQKGTYWLTYFALDSDRLVEFNRICQLNEAILRQMTLKIDPRLVEPMVAHARGETLPVPPSPDSVTGSAAEGEEEEEEEETEEVSGPAAT